MNLNNLLTVLLFFGESENLYFQKVYRGVDALDAKFESLSLDIISPLFAALSEES